ncbi:YopX family protein [Bacillus halotolerans]|uniref:YopX family protein n=1 Tax=Bacillus halotolerans TaxID=260554 RepID=UPI004049A62E
MRQIKFRAWHKKWDRLINDIFLGDSEVKFPIGNTSDILDINEEYSNLIFQQYTGLKDKSEAGQEVWEGDIRKDALGRIFKVVYDNDLAAFYGEYTNGHYESLGDCGPNSEFLGTVYQNPELLEASHASE